MRIKNLLFAMSTLAVFLFVQACTKKEEISIPTITSFTPKSGLPGTTVKITGTGFSSTPSKNYVTIAGVQATVTEGTSTSITAIVSPLAATNTSGKVTVTVGGLTAVSSDDFGVTAVPPVQTTTVTGEITADTHWTADMHILLSGYVYVTAGHTLTIDPGTLIKGDKATKGTLLIEQGAKIMAAGTAQKPIVFTSNQPQGQRNYGDWGGVILCGKAKTNWSAYKDALTGVVQPAGIGQVEGGPRSLYGGTDDTDNSGVLRYCRIEFGGVALSQDNEINGLTLCGVGNGTTIDHIQVSYSGDDSFEWFGGAVNSKYLIAHRGWDDDFDTDNGFSGKVQFAVGLRDPNAADQSGSKGFETDSYQSTTSKTLPTSATFSNVTIIGGVINPNSTAYDPQFVAAVHMRKGSQQKFYNNVFAAYPAGVLISNEIGSSGGDSYKLLSQSLVDVITIKSCLLGGIPTNQTKTYYGITPVNGAATATFDKNFVIVTNNTRSRTPSYEVAGTSGTAGQSNIAPYIDSANFVTWFQSQTGGASYSGPYGWLGSSISRNTAAKNICVYTEQTGVRLTNPFTLDNPNFYPTSTSPITVGGAVPKMNPDFTGTAADAWFDKVTYIGAFDPSQDPATNWTLLWTKWDPNNADYGAAY